jgi:hypothetical protein
VNQTGPSAVGHSDDEPCRPHLAGTTFDTGFEIESARHGLSSLFAFEFGQPFSHLFGSEARAGCIQRGDEGLQGSSLVFWRSTGDSPLRGTAVESSARDAERVSSFEVLLS